MDPASDASQLAEAAARGDRGAFEALVARDHDRIRGLIAARLSKRYVLRVDADDVFQEVMLRAFRAVESFRWCGDDSLVRWLGGFVENVISEQARELARTRTVRLPGQLPASGVSASRAARRGERFERLRAAVDKLSPEHREVVLLTRLEGLKFAEVAERMGRSPDAVKQLFYRALGQLRDHFGDTASLGLDERSLERPGGAGDG